MCFRSFERHIDESQENGLRQIRHFLPYDYGKKWRIKVSSSEMMGDIIAHDIDLLFESHRFEYRPLR